jgi:methylated-DNA-protein-cysteine methyltransferase-like protein
VTFHDEVWRLVRRVPRGRVATYGQIAAMLGRPRSARAVGQAMAALGGPGGARGVTEVPWHRVVNAQGGISRRTPSAGMLTQRLRLQGEGIRVRGGRVDLGRFQWEAAPRRGGHGRRPAGAEALPRARPRPGWFDEE